MSARAAAPALALTFAALMAATVGLVLFAGARPDALIGLAVTGYVVVGCLIAVRQPRNAVGWLLLGIGLAFAVQEATEAYIASDLDAGRAAVGWVSSPFVWGWLAGAGVFLPLVFPHGRLLSPRWRAAVWLGVTAVALNVFATQFTPGALDLDTEGIANPLGATGDFADVVAVVEAVGWVTLAAAVLTSAVALVLRFRRSRGTERQQLKWFAFVGALALVTLLVGMTTPRHGGPAWAEVLGAICWFATFGLVVFGIPLATGIAILRHRLYDVDVVIRRTLVYGALTATLGATYLGLVLLSGLAVGESDLAVAAATLAVAALFRPAPRARPGGGGPAVLPASLRRRPHARGLRVAPARGARPRRREPRAADGGGGERAAGARLRVAEERVVTVRRAAWGAVGRGGGARCGRRRRLPGSTSPSPRRTAPGCRSAHCRPWSPPCSASPRSACWSRSAFPPTRSAGCSPSRACCWRRPSSRRATPTTR